MSWHGYRPYVPVATRRAQARKKMEKLRKKGRDIKPVQIEGRKIARTFWGQAWCDHLESFSDFENRLPRGRTYVRNGSVCHLGIAAGEVEAMVSGSTLYTVNIGVEPLSKKKWERLKTRCAGKIGSLLELLQGKLSENVMSVVTDRRNGLFPLPGEITFRCSCPDWAVMCKHVAAVLYGVGARLDQSPELLFLLRGVNQDELVRVGVDAAASAETQSTRRRIAADAVGDVFGIEMADTVAPETSPALPGGTAVTGKTVIRLRTKFGISRSDFAALLGVSTTSVAKWEKHPGQLHLQTRTLEAVVAAKKLTKKEVRRKLDGT